MMCLRRLMGRRKPFLTYNYNYNYNTKTVSTGKAASFSRFISFGTQNHFTAKHGCDSEEENRIQKGDHVNLSQLLFTTNRDYLIRFNDPRPVTADKFAGKVIVLYFVPINRDSICDETNTYRNTLVDTYNDLKSKNCFEVVLVVVDDVPIFSVQPGQICSDPSLQGKFDDIWDEVPICTL
ncbi:hypothetical protein POM88_022945 [Heracleum sosnowskyi]|uniref:Thioredoxin-like fold domain-containing protein n=1 Tax=Heracleum sosnowskyi TaxID=360622 RepID=A0AAD8IJR4_9APIA|nr:hypothetical protein POM88_022945 [Heracleum sosnowskyi]